MARPPGRRFRMAWFPIWRAEMLLLAFFALLDSAHTYFAFGRFELKPIPIPWPHALLIAMFFGSFCVFFPVYIREDGLRVPDDHGTYLDVSWVEIERIRAFDFLGMKALRLGVAGRKEAVWLPTSLVGMRAFADLVAEHAGEAHPLTVRLARHRTPTDRFHDSESLPGS